MKYVGYRFLYLTHMMLDVKLKGAYLKIFDK